MRPAISIGIAIFILGIGLGVIGTKLGLDRLATQEKAPTTRKVSQVPPGMQVVEIAEQGLSLHIRTTDSLVRLTDEAKTVVGARFFDTWAGDASSAPAIDLMWTRQEKQFDQPTATSLDEYRKPTVDGLTIQETKDLTIDGRKALKQLYTATAEVPGPFGSTQQQPMPNLLRYVIQDGERFFVLRAPGARQTFLDSVAQSIKFGQAGAGTSQSTDSLPIDAAEDTGLNIETVAPATDADGPTLKVE